MNIEARCVTRTRASMIKFEEQGRKAVVQNPDRSIYKKIRVDRCVIVNNIAADFILSKIGLGDVIIELKGVNVERAVEQVEATAAFWHSNGYREGKLGAIVVSRQFPKVGTAIRKAQKRFAANFKSPLHVVTKNYKGSIEKIFSFNGPHKI